MFKPSSIRALSLIAIILTCFGMGLSIFVALKQSGIYFIGCLSWALLIWASIIAYQLSSYKLYETEYKKVMFNVLLIIIAFFLSLFTGVIIGVLVAAILLAKLWGLKKNYDEWDSKSEQQGL